MTDNRANVDNAITEQVETFLEQLRSDMISKFPDLDKEYIEHQIDNTLEEAYFDWPWS